MWFDIGRKKAKIRNRYNQAPHLTQYQWESDNFTIKTTQTGAKRAGDHRALINRGTIIFANWLSLKVRITTSADEKFCDMSYFNFAVNKAKKY